MVLRMTAMTIIKERPPKPAYALAVPLPEIPAIKELASHRQWLTWDYRWDDKKWTKPPLHPNGDFRCDPTAQKTLVSFDEALRIVRARRRAGIGFSLQQGDELTGIDLDGCRNPDTGEIDLWASDIVELRETYWEVTPSGRGIRAFVRGKIEKAIKRDALGVEMYVERRYLTITGDIVPGSVDFIGEAPKTIAALRKHIADLEPAQEKVVQLPRQFHAGVDPNDRIAEIRSALSVLSAEGYHDWLMVGMALENELGPGGRGIWDEWSATSAKFSDKAQAEKWRSFRKEGVTMSSVFARANALGWRWASRPQLSDAEIAENDRLAAQVIKTYLEKQAAPAVIEPPQTTLPEYCPDFPEHLTHIPGAVGDMIDWIEASARFPSRAMALPAALLVTGTAMGRQWAGPTESATHLYGLVTAPTSGGKDHILTTTSALMEAGGLSDLLGPPDFQSATAMINFLVRQALGLCVMDEFGMFLSRISEPRAGPYVRDIGKVMRELWCKKFEPYRTPEWAQRQSVTIQSPALSILGVSTPEEFYQGLTDRVVGNGLLNRFFAISLAKKPKEQTPAMSGRTPPAHLGDILNRLYMPGGIAPSYTLPGASSHKLGKPKMVKWGPGAEAVYVTMREHVEAFTEGFGKRAAFFARTCEMAVRAATIVAGGISQNNPVLTADLMIWGRDLMLWSHRDMMEKTVLYIAETQAQADTKRVYRAILAHGGPISKSQLTLTLDHALSRKVRDEAVAELVEAGRVIEVKMPTAGRAAIHYIARETAEGKKGGKEG